jgi:hypothetical protein
MSQIRRNLLQAHLQRLSGILGLIRHSASAGQLTFLQMTVENKKLYIHMNLHESKKRFFTLKKTENQPTSSAATFFLSQHAKNWLQD